MTNTKVKCNECSQNDKYVVKVLEAIPHCQTVEDYEALLPWNINLEKVEAVSVAT